MIRRQRDIDEQNRQLDALAERWELRIHAIALTITAVVLAMRLVAGRQDLTSAACDDTGQQPAGEILGAATNGEERAASAPERRAVGDERSSP